MMRDILMPFSSAARETVPVTEVSRTSVSFFSVRNFSGRRKLEMPTWRIGTLAPRIPVAPEFCMSGRLSL